MRIAAHQKNTWVLSFERGEELFAALGSFLERERITAGFFAGLGAAQHVELAFYNLKTKQYERHNVEEDLEILSLTGNIAWKDVERILHIHGVFGRRDLSTLGGHLFRLIVSAVCEVHLTTLPGKMGGAFGETTGLHTLCNFERGP